MTEFELISRHFDRGAVRNAELGIGDDAAIVDPGGNHVVTCTDMLVEGRHFFAGADAASLGYKSLMVNLSDLAAMGARPVAFLLALSLPQANEQWVAAFAAGLFEAADQVGVELIGGDTTRGPLNICITAHGLVPPQAAIRRDRAEPGHDVWVSGSLGGAAAAVRWRNNPDNWPALAATVSDQISRRLDWPRAQVRLGLELRHVASAAIDVSDGLIADLGHVAERSRVAIAIAAENVPVDPAVGSMMSASQALALALNGGDDYELAFTADPENRVAISGIGDRLGVTLSRIGSVHGGQGVQAVGYDGMPIVDLPDGHDHFS